MELHCLLVMQHQFFLNLSDLITDVMYVLVKIAYDQTTTKH